MATSSVVLKVTKSETYGREASITFTCENLYDARLMEDNLQRHSREEFYVSCKSEYIEKVCENIGAAFIKQ